MKTLFKNLPIIFLVLTVIAYFNTGGASSIVFWSMVILASMFTCTNAVIRIFLHASEELHKKSAIAHAKIMDKLLTEQADYILTKTESDKSKDNKSKINKNTSDEDFEGNEDEDTMEIDCVSLINKNKR